jgi:hypothetical protein
MKLIKHLLLFLLATSVAIAAPTRPKDQTPATAPAADDTIMLDGTTQGTRALPAGYYLPAKPWAALGVTTGTTAVAWGTKNTVTLTGNLTISSFTGTEDARSWYFIQGVFTGSQVFTFPASFRNGQTNTTTSTLTPSAGRHTFKFESLNGSGTYLLTDTVATATPATSVSVAATPANYTPGSATLEAHLSAIDTKLGTVGSGTVDHSAYNSGTWDASALAPDQNAVRDKFVAVDSAIAGLSGGSLFTTEMGVLWPTADIGSLPAGWLATGSNGIPSFTAIGSYSMIVKSGGSVAAPTFSPAAGSYSSTQSVTLATATSGAAIRYTTNGTDPTRSSGTVYSTPVSVASTATVKAIAYKDYWADTAVQSAAYTISGGTPVTLIQGVAGSSNFGGTTATAVFSSNVVAGDRLVVGVQWGSATATTISSVTDTQGNVYTISSASKASATTVNFPNAYTQIAYAVAASSAANTITITFSATSTGWVNALEISPSSFDQVAAATGSGTAISAGTITTVNNGSFGFAASITDDNAGAGGGWTAGSGWTLFQNTGGGSSEQGAEYIAQSTAGALSGDFAQARTGTWAASFVTFKP